MKKLLSVIICIVTLCLSPVCGHAAEKPSVSAQAYVLYCPDNGQVLFEQNAHERMKPASTTKLMTTLLTLEAAAKGNKLLTFTPEMTAEGSSMYLKYGDRLRLSDLAVGMMMCSGNDAANASALTVSGSFEKFSRLMNERAAQLGMKDTHFVTPSGLDDDDHYSSAYDLALLMAAGLENEDFAGLTSQKSASVTFENPRDKRVSYPNHNRLLSLDSRCIGGKTGYTMTAGRCLVSAARQDGVTLICVTLNDRNDWNDHIALYDSGFERLESVNTDGKTLSVPVVGGESGSVRVKAARTGLVCERGKSAEIKEKITLDSFLYAPVKKGETVGKITYTLGKTTLGSAELVAAESVAQAKPKGVFEKIKEWWQHGEKRADSRTKIHLSVRSGVPPQG